MREIPELFNWRTHNGSDAAEDHRNSDFYAGIFPESQELSYARGTSSRSRSFSRLHAALAASPMVPAIQVDSVSKTFTVGSRVTWSKQSRRTVRALTNVSLRVASGEIYGLVGRNGYGKTTLIKCICSLIEPTSGRVSVFDLDPVRQARGVHRLIGYVGADERSFYWRLTGRQNLLFFARLQGVDAEVAERRIRELSERFDVVQLLDRRFFEYSTGNRQRLAVVRALLHDPRLLVLDEPTRSLDPFAADALRRALVEWITSDPGRSVFITSHNLAEVEQLSHRVGIMSRGQLLEQGTLGELRTRFDDRERICLWLDHAADLRTGDFDASGAETVSLRVDAGERTCVEFRHRASDTVLDAVLRAVHAAGARVRSFERVELSLQDIIDRVDGEGAAT